MHLTEHDRDEYGPADLGDGIRCLACGGPLGDEGYGALCIHCREEAADDARAAYEQATAEAAAMDALLVTMWTWEPLDRWDEEDDDEPPF